MTNEVFGEITHKTMWQKKDTFVLYGKEYEITVFIDGKKTESPTKLQEQAYQEFCNRKTELTTEIEQKLFEYYQTVCEECREMFDDKADMYAPIVENPSQLKGFVKPQSISIPKSDDKRIVNVLFKTKWDLEMGAGIRFVNEKVEIVGVQSDVL